MTNIDKFKYGYNNNEQRNNNNTTKVLIFTSVNDDDDEKILSCLTPTNGEFDFVHLNNKNITDMSSINNNKRYLLQTNEMWNDYPTNKKIKSRKADLTCVVCKGHAYGYNFDQITCESCKAFFRRNALHQIENTKCLNLNNGLRCDIRYDVKHKCQRCRLLKCLESGMRKEFILTSEEKLFKQQRLEANRCKRSTQINSNINNIKLESIEESPSMTFDYAPIIATPPPPSYHLTESDWSYLYFIQNAYLSASQSTPSASSVTSPELASDKMSTYMNTLDLQNFGAVRLINFLRKIPDFEELDGNDRLILVKYNLCLLDILRHALKFDTTRELAYDNNSNSLVSANEEEFAERMKSLFILCYGYEISRVFVVTLRTLSNLVDKDPNIVQLLMLTVILLKGLSISDDQEPVLNDSRRVFLAQSKFTDLLFRYLIQRSSFNAAVIKMMRIVEVIMKAQRLVRDFHQNVKSKIDINYINPLMKSLLHLT